jgi:phage shock protein C
MPMASFARFRRTFKCQYKEDAMNDKSPGTAIAEARREKGLSQDGVAYLCKMNVRTVQRIEGGQVNPRASTLKKLSGVLGCDLNAMSKPDDGVARQGFRAAFREAISRIRFQKGDDGMRKQNVLQRLARSRKDRRIAGICGGLGEHSGIPAWLWRLMFLAAIFLYGSGFFAYVLLWIFMPRAGQAADKARSRHPNWLERLERSDADRKLGGVCGGLGAHTQVPSWCWRIVFLVLTPLHGAGIALYALLCIFVPKPDGNHGRLSLSGGRQAA